MCGIYREGPAFHYGAPSFPDSEAVLLTYLQQARGVCIDFLNFAAVLVDYRCEIESHRFTEGMLSCIGDSLCLPNALHGLFGIADAPQQRRGIREQRHPRVCHIVQESVLRLIAREAGFQVRERGSEFAHIVKRRAEGPVCFYL